MGSEYIPSLVGSRGEKKIEGNEYIKPAIYKGQHLTLGIFDQENNTRKHGLQAIEATVKEIYTHHATFDTDKGVLSMTWFDLWQSLRLIEKYDELEGLSMNQITNPWAVGREKTK